MSKYKSRFWPKKHYYKQHHNFFKKNKFKKKSFKKIDYYAIFKKNKRLQRLYKFVRRFRYKHLWFRQVLKRFQLRYLYSYLNLLSKYSYRYKNRGYKKSYIVNRKAISFLHKNFFDFKKNYKNFILKQRIFQLAKVSFIKQQIYFNMTRLFKKYTFEKRYYRYKKLKEFNNNTNQMSKELFIFLINFKLKKKLLITKQLISSSKGSYNIKTLLLKIHKLNKKNMINTFKNKKINYFFIFNKLLKTTKDIIISKQYNKNKLFSQYTKNIKKSVPFFKSNNYIKKNFLYNINEKTIKLKGNQKILNSSLTLKNINYNSNRYLNSIYSQYAQDLIKNFKQPTKLKKNLNKKKIPLYNKTIKLRALKFNIFHRYSPTFLNEILKSKYFSIKKKIKIQSIKNIYLLTLINKTLYSKYTSSSLFKKTLSHMRYNISNLLFIKRKKLRKSFPKKPIKYSSRFNYNYAKYIKFKYRLKRYPKTYKLFRPLFKKVYISILTSQDKKFINFALKSFLKQKKIKFKKLLFKILLFKATKKYQKKKNCLVNKLQKIKRLRLNKKLYSYAFKKRIIVRKIIKKLANKQKRKIKFTIRKHRLFIKLNNALQWWEKRDIRKKTFRMSSYKERIIHFYNYTHNFGRKATRKRAFSYTLKRRFYLLNGQLRSLPIPKRIRRTTNKYIYQLSNLMYRNRNIFWNKNWKYTKLNKKIYMARKFLSRSLTYGNFRRQDSFKLLHTFRTIFLKYSFGYKGKYLLKSYGILKNKLPVNESALNFANRFLWHMERSVNILTLRAKYFPNIKISNHLIRYGFLLTNNKLILNPYTRVNLFDIVRITKRQLFLRLLITNFLFNINIKKKSLVPFYMETNKRILALAVHRLPKFKDFTIVEKLVRRRYRRLYRFKTIVPRIEGFFYKVLPILASNC